MSIPFKPSNELEGCQVNQIYSPPFSSSFSLSVFREKSTTMATFLADVLKKSWGADCCLLGSGFNRASVDYKGRQAFLYSDLVNELPMEIATGRLPP